MEKTATCVKSGKEIYPPMPATIEPLIIFPVTPAITRDMFLLFC
jgi:hypothetical protein